MVKVGCVNIDTSHPMGFAESMQKAGRARYVAVYNDSFRGKAEVEGFAERFGPMKICETIDEMAELCDIVFIQGCNWDDHLRCAKPFIDKKIPIFIDKPVVGNLKECNELLALEKSGAVILGASAARYAYEIKEFLEKSTEERGEVIAINISCGVDEFNYGCHVVEVIGKLLGTGAKSVKYIGKAQVDSFYTQSSFVGYENGKGAIFTTMSGMWLPFDIVIYTTKGAFPMRLDSAKLYDALIEEVCDYMDKKQNNIASVSEMVESVKICLAMLCSKAQDGKEIAICSLSEDMPSFDGKVFCDGYAAAAGKMYAL